MMKEKIVSFGEIVWDRFGESSTLGGAPLNAAYHIHRQKWPVLLISRIGNDELGRQTLDRITSLGLNKTGIQQDPELPTGIVTVNMDRNNEPHFAIEKPAAWDNINLEEVLSVIENDRFHLLFGTLSQRETASRKALRTLWQKADILMYDVNLRPPFTPLEYVFDSLQASTLVKVNLDELLILGREFTHEKTDKYAMASSLLETFNLSMLAVTEGADGAWLAHRDGINEHPGFPVSVADTVGSGDAFLSGVVTGYLEGLPFAECLIRANRLGSFVASRKGATPDYEES